MSETRRMPADGPDRDEALAWAGEVAMNSAELSDAEFAAAMDRSNPRFAPPAAESSDLTPAQEPAETAAEAPGESGEGHLPPVFIGLDGSVGRGVLPADATWEDYVSAHGGAQASGWWVTLCWYDGEDPRPEAVGPYSSYAQAVCAMQDSLLIDSFCEDTKGTEWLDDVYVAPESATITQTCAAYDSRVTLIDPGDPDHFGTDDPTTATPPPSGSAALQAGALSTAPAHRGDPAQPADLPGPIDRSGPTITR
ncbi:MULTISPECIES: hypothetical protein [unclassified Nocardioides]|uniref:hypothetical protein n=1 Tax=unclassified Nocardioides TaxID=2615069 RepID=UPI000A26C970|nr:MULTISPECIES: hypothetical protein [unclassified Nocardioides]